MGSPVVAAKPMGMGVKVVASTNGMDRTGHGIPVRQPHAMLSAALYDSGGIARDGLAPSTSHARQHGCRQRAVGEHCSSRRTTMTSAWIVTSLMRSWKTRTRSRLQS